MKFFEFGMTDVVTKIMIKPAVWSYELKFGHQAMRKQLVLRAF